MSAVRWQDLDIIVADNLYKKGVDKIMEGKKRGRPKGIHTPIIKINQREFEKLCAMQCNLDEIAGWFACSPDTIERYCKRTYNKNYEDVFAEKRVAGKIGIRRMQMELAKKSPAMAIFLGKQYLGQRDIQEVAVSKTTDENIKEIEDYFTSKKQGVNTNDSNCTSMSEYNND